MRRVWIAANHLHVSPDALCRAVAAQLGIGRSAVYLLQLSVINITTKRVFNRLQVRLVAVRGKLHVPIDAICTVLHEVVRPTRITPSHKVANAQLGIGVYCCPDPYIAPS